MVIPAVTGALLEYHRTGKLRILAVTGPARLVAAPDISVVNRTAVLAGSRTRGLCWLRPKL
jgi:hypothetical protein